MVRVSLSGQGTGQGGMPLPPQDSVKGGAQPEGGTGGVQAQLPHQGPSCRLGLGLPFSGKEGVSWLPGGCTPQLSPCSTAHRSVLQPVTSCAPPKQVLTPVLDTPQLHMGYPLSHRSSQKGEAPCWNLHQCFCCGCSSLPPTLGKMWCPDPAARSAAVRDSPA